MKVAGEYTFDAPQELVWEALQDPDVLSSIMPGGEGFEEIGENEYAGQLKVRVGPVQGRFKGNIKLSDIVAPESYHIAVDGKGAPGFVRATGSLKLTGMENTTHMSYDGDAQIGGRIASVGQRLIDTSAKSIIRQSLEGLNEYVKLQASAQAAATSAGASAETAAQVEMPEYAAPSQSQVAFNVAKDVVGDLIPARYRPVVAAIVFIVAAVILYLILSSIG